MTSLPDVNVWIALTVAQHVHHAVARDWFEESGGDAVAFCRVTQMGFLRLLTNPRVMNADALTAGRAWKILDTLLSDARIAFAGEPAALERYWRATASASQTGPNFWTDAYLAAFATACGYTVVTFDAGFRRYKGVALKLLS